MRNKFALGSLIYSYYGMYISEGRYTGYTSMKKVLGYIGLFQ
jgi:hypothetical protein